MTGYPYKIQGNWLISYRPENFSYHQVLAMVLRLQAWAQQHKAYPDRHRIELNQQYNGNHYYREPTKGAEKPGTLFFKLQHVEPKVIELKDNISVPEQNIKKIPLKNVLLYYPMVAGDPRWESIGLPVSSLLLGSSLHQSGFKVKTSGLKLPFENRKIEDSFDLIGFTLFEDILSQSKTAINNIRSGFNGILAAGGPMVTLNPLAAAYHLPGINLLVRGESEIILPSLLEIISSGDLDKLFQFNGILLNLEGILLLSGFDQVNLPHDLESTVINLGFLDKKHLSSGLEINFSRGCSRNCIFCAKVQGKKIRKLPITKIKNLLNEYTAKLDQLNLSSDESRTININDDDILQDPEYFRSVLDQIRQHSFRIWGVQTSLQSFFTPELRIKGRLLEILKTKDIFAGTAPMVWLGTDTFLRKRGKRLGKIIPDRNNIEELLHNFETLGIQNYHYWISSDFASTWPELASEVLFIHKLYKEFKSFHVIAHAPFLVPYPSSPLFRLLIKKGLANQIVFKDRFPAPIPEFNFNTVEKVITRFENLNRLLENVKDLSGKGFIDYFKVNDYYNVFLRMYELLKKDRLLSELSPGAVSGGLLKTEAIIEAVLAKW